MRIAIILLLALSVNISNVFAVDGVPYFDLRVGDKTYLVPKANKDYEQELYMLQKSLNGDKEALQVFVGAHEYRDFFIGDYETRWIRVYRDGKAKVTPE